MLLLYNDLRSKFADCISSPILVHPRRQCGAIATPCSFLQQAVVAVAEKAVISGTGAAYTSADKSRYHCVQMQSERRTAFPRYLHALVYLLSM